MVSRGLSPFGEFSIQTSLHDQRERALSFPTNFNEMPPLPSASLFEKEFTTDDFEDILASADVYMGEGMGKFSDVPASSAGRSQRLTFDRRHYFPK